MSLNIGTLVGYLQLDDTQFNRKADAADKKINGLKLHLEALGKSNPKISVEVTAQTKALEDVQARIVALKAQAASGVDVRVEMVQALIEVDRLQTKLREMHNAEIKVHVDDAEALTKLAALKKATDSIDKANLGGVGGMFGNIAAFGPALLPMVNMLPGGLFAIGSGAIAAASGVGVLALAFHGLGSAAAAYNSYQNQLPFAVTAKQKYMLKKQLSLSAYGDATPQAQTFARTLISQGLPAEQQIKGAAQAGVLPGMTKALMALMPMVPAVSHLVKSLGTDMGDMGLKAAKALNGPFWHQWFTWLGRDAKTQLPLIGGIFGHFITGLMQGIERFSPQGTSLLTWLDHLMIKFENWTGSPQFEHFMATTAADATLVGHALQPLGPILVNLYKGLSATGTVELQILGTVLSGIAMLPTGALQAIGMLLPVIFTTLKAVALSTSIVAGIRSIGAAFTFLATAEGLAAGAARAGVIAAGLLIIANAGDRTSKSVGALQGVLGGAVAGAGIGMFAGPEGAAIGAGLGAATGGLIGLARAMTETATATNKAGPPMESYIGTLQVGTKAITGFTKALVVQNATADGAIAAGRKLGLASKTVVDAIMGVPAAQAAVAAAMKRSDDSIAKSGGVLTQAQYDAAAAAATLGRTVADNQNALQADIVRLNEAALAAGHYAKVLPGIPHIVATRIDQLGLNAAEQNIIRLTARYNLTPKQVATVMRADGVDPTLAAIRSIMRQAQILADSRSTLKIDADISGATSKVKTLASQIQSILGPALASLPPATPPPHTGPKGHAFGGTVEGQRSPYGDKTLVLAAPGEEVTPNDKGQADKNRGALKAAARGATLIAMASGGTVPPNPLAGFNPGNVPSSGKGHHSKSHAAAAAAKAARAKAKAARLRLARFHKHIQSLLTADTAALATTDAQIAAAQQWSSTFAGNAFSANLAPFESAGPVTTSIVNGMTVTQSAATDTSPAGILKAMLAYQKSQQTDAGNLAGWVKTLRNDGISTAVLNQMEAAGPQGLAEIQALALGTKAQVQRFNAGNVATTASLNQTGAQATTGQDYSTLQRRQLNEQSMQKVLKQALASPVPVRIIHNHLRP